MIWAKFESVDSKADLPGYTGRKEEKMTYNELKKMAEGKEFPLIGTTGDNEPCIVERGRNENGRFFKITIAQDNDWLYIVTLWDDGTAEGTFEK